MNAAQVVDQQTHAAAASSHDRSTNDAFPCQFIHPDKDTNNSTLDVSVLGRHIDECLPFGQTTTCIANIVSTVSQTRSDDNAHSAQVNECYQRLSNSSIEMSSINESVATERICDSVNGIRTSTSSNSSNCSRSSSSSTNITHPTVIPQRTSLTNDAGKRRHAAPCVASGHATSIVSTTTHSWSSVDICQNDNAQEDERYKQQTKNNSTILSSINEHSSLIQDSSTTVPRRTSKRRKRGVRDGEVVEEHNSRRTRTKVTTTPLAINASKHTIILQNSTNVIGPTIASRKRVCDEAHADDTKVEENRNAQPSRRATRTANTTTLVSNESIHTPPQVQDSATVLRPTAKRRKENDKDNNALATYHPSSIGVQSDEIESNFGVVSEFKQLNTQHDETSPHGDDAAKSPYLCIDCRSGDEQQATESAPIDDHHHDAETTTRNSSPNSSKKDFRGDIRNLFRADEDYIHVLLNLELNTKQYKETSESGDTYIPVVHKGLEKNFAVNDKDKARKLAISDLGTTKLLQEEVKGVGGWLGGKTSLVDFAAILMGGIDKMKEHVESFVEEDGSPECPGEIALRLNNIIQVSEEFKATILGFQKGTVALLHQKIKGKIYPAAFSVVNIDSIVENNHCKGALIKSDRCGCRFVRPVKSFFLPRPANTRTHTHHLKRHRSTPIMDDLTAPRKLTSTETSRLRSLLHSKLNLRPDDEQSKEDAADLLDYAFAMIANGKNVNYVVTELKSMEMEVCNSASAEMLGRTLGKFLLDLKHGNVGGGVGAADNDERRSSNNNHRGGESGTTSMKSTNNNNTTPPANANNGRDGGGRGGGGRNNNNHYFERQPSSSGRGGGGGRSLHNAAFNRLNNNNNNSGIPPQDQHRNRGSGPPPPPAYDHNDNNRHRDNNNNNNGNSNSNRAGRGDNWGASRGGGPSAGRGGRNGGGGGRGDFQGGGRGGRGVVMVGFNNTSRGEQQQQQQQQQQQFKGGGRDPQYTGRGGVNNGGRLARGGGGGGGRSFQYNELSGTRRTREEEKEVERGNDDFIPALDKGLSSGRGDVEQQQHQSKKHRWINGSGDDDYAEQQQQQQQQNWGGGNDETMTESWDKQSYQGRGGIGRGGRGGRSSSGRGGRGGGGRFASSTTYYPNNNDQQGEGAEEGYEAEYSPTEEAAFVSESPLIAASFGRGRGRGFYRGGGRGGGRGRGRGGREVVAGRAEVAEKLSAMVWKRPRTMDEGLSTAR